MGKITVVKGEYEKINKNIESYKNNREKVPYWGIISTEIGNDIIIHQYGEGIRYICKDTFRKKIGKMLIKNILEIEGIGKKSDSRIEKTIVENNIRL